jgi:hypothetical protein
MGIAAVAVLSVAVIGADTVAAFAQPVEDDTAAPDSSEMDTDSDGGDHADPPFACPGDGDFIDTPRKLPNSPTLMLVSCMCSTTTRCAMTMNDSTPAIHCRATGKC